MSDFFYKEKLVPMFSPVISVKKDNLSPTIVSAIDNLLSPSGNMFTRAETVKNLMKIEKLGIDETAKALSLKSVDVASKLRLLEFSKREREAILEYGFCESSALQFLRIDKVSRLYAMEFCRKSSYDASRIESYIDGLVNSGNNIKSKIAKKGENIRKFVVGDVGFFLNSIDNALRIARSAGLDVSKENKEDDNGLNIHISVKRQDLCDKVDKNEREEYNS